jgi:hypothetical protein
VRSAVTSDDDGQQTNTTNTTIKTMMAMAYELVSDGDGPTQQSNRWRWAMEPT